VLCACAVAAIFGTGLWSLAKYNQWAETSTSNDLSEVAKLSQEIAVFTLPDGFGSPYGMHVGEITSVGFSSHSKNTHILLTQFPEGTSINTEELLKQVGKYSMNPDSGWNNTRMTVIEENPVIIRGQESILSISEGTSSDGTIYRSAITTFDSNKGVTMLVIAGPLEEWDRKLVDDFVASIQ
jgi:hypothetical protein